MRMRYESVEISEADARGGRGWRRGRGSRVLRDESGAGLIEVLVASTVAMIGLLSLSGLQLAVATQSRVGQWRTGQALAAQEVLERVIDNGYAVAASGTDSATINGHVYQVNLVVTNSAIRVKQVRATVAAVGSLGPQAFVTRIYEPRAVPPAP